MKLLTTAVAAVIEDPAGRLLLCQQSAGHRLWTLPGGRIRLGESPIHAAVRDIFVEAGSDVKIIDLVGLYQLTGDGCGDDLPDLLVHVFRGRLDGEATLNDPGRIRRLCWYERTSLPNPMTATTRSALADATAGRSGVLREVFRDTEPEIPDAEIPEAVAAV
jgi:ADP-ribose pyrophosphatase YjhB (NUDIX family)